jgi:hypothetical protein
METLRAGSDARVTPLRGAVRMRRASLPTTLQVARAVRMVPLHPSGEAPLKWLYSNL